MMSDALTLLLDALLQPYAAILLFRFHAVWLRIPMRNPLGEFIMALTDVIVLPARKRIPTAWGFDLPTLLLALLAEFIYLTLFLLAQGGGGHDLPLAGLLVLAGVKLLKISLYLLIIAVFVQAILSWIRPYNSLTPLLDACTRPFLQPIRSVVPLFGNVDLSPLLLFLVCQLLLIIPIGALEHMALALFR